MGIPSRLEQIFHKAVDLFFAVKPQPVPAKGRLQHCKIVSHRGEHDMTVMENTVAAFDRALEGKIWGLEFDVRWTKDLYPVVFHDRDCNRLFSVERAISAMTLAELRADFPLIPSLTEVVRRYGKKMHLMVELKVEDYPDPRYQKQVLQEIFSFLTPREDYHVLSLSPEVLEVMDFVVPQAMLPVAQLNFHRLSKLATDKKYSGVAGHYLFITNGLLKKHQQRGQQVGTGFVGSRNCLCRELNRGVEWIFTDNALQVQAIRDDLLRLYEGKV